MPIYEYRCGACRRRFTVFFRSLREVSAPACAHCGATTATKLPSRVRQLRSDEDRLESLADPSGLSDVNEEDPRSVARWAAKMGREMGEDVGEDFGEAMEAMESGEGGLADDHGGTGDAEDDALED